MRKDMRMRAKTFTEPKPINLQILFFNMREKAFFVQVFFQLHSKEC